LQIEKYDWSPDSSAKIEKGWIIKADTLKELARRTDVFLTYRINRVSQLK